MTVKKMNKKDVKKAEFKGFFNYEIPSDLRAECKEYCRKEDEVGLEIENALASGYKLTVVRNEKSDGYQASMQSFEPTDVNAGLVMSAYAKHWYLALGVLMYKHAVLLQKTWEASEEVPPDEDFG